MTVRAAVVLAGGPSRRLGRPKALVPVGGVPMVARVAAAALDAVDEVLVVAKRTFLAPVRTVVPPGVRVLVDSRDIQTPLIGFATGAKATAAPYVAFLACDLPFLKPALLRRMFAAARGHDAAIPRWPDGKIEPMVAVYRREPAHQGALEALAEKRFANSDMIERLGDPRFVAVDDLRRSDPDLVSFLNVNTPEDLAAAEARARA